MIAEVMGGWVEHVWEANDFSFGNIKPEVLVDHPQVPQGAFQMVTYGSHCVCIWGSREWTDQHAWDSCWQVNGRWSWWDLPGKRLITEACMMEAAPWGTQAFGGRDGWKKKEVFVSSKLWGVPAGAIHCAHCRVLEKAESGTGVVTWGWGGRGDR